VCSKIISSGPWPLIREHVADVAFYGITTVMELHDALTRRDLPRMLKIVDFEAVDIGRAMYMDADADGRLVRGPILESAPVRSCSYPSISRPSAPPGQPSAD
jgi:hypothetical protein